MSNNPADEAKKLEELKALDDQELAVSALRAALELPLSQGQVPRDVASNARLLLELSGAVGRNAKPPVDDDDPLTELSASELKRVAEGDK